MGELTVVEAIEAGMVAHLPVATTTLDHLCRAIDDAAAGRPTLPPPTLHRLVDEAWNEGATTSELSPRDLDVVQGIRAGESVKQTARRLGVSRKTVENGRHRLFLRFGVHSAAELDRAVGPL
ncbi:LuxR C-terminal-related transcriptional regulator [Ilumatobacter sp.]|uniref:LuxR family transcriptional regulator n=1 Tax=Ilumatobacter sp. TaxID=1967498 RepID=UPI003B51EA60